MVDGKIKLCKTGCIACPSNKCSGCSPGYVFDENANTCYSCGVGCLNCDPTHPNICSSCRIGSYLSGTDCIPCDPTCVACSGSSTSCTTCPPGQYYDSDPSVLQCSFCLRNCRACTSSSTCDTCNKGFAWTGTSCIPCSLSCS